ncbi:hypothetical protein HDU76_000858, partial [Blyttiomyces sp. JEL0837]
RANRQLGPPARSPGALSPSNANSTQPSLADDPPSKTDHSSGQSDSSDAEDVDSENEKELNQFPMRNGPQRATEVTASSTAPTRRRKVPLGPGFSALDWNKLRNSGTDLKGVTAIKRYTPSEVAAHKSKEDCWMAISGKVYNVTHYLRFHPGGVGQLMRGAGKDATELFLKVHPWVNLDYLLGDKCLVGYLIPENMKTAEQKAADAAAAKSVAGPSTLWAPVKQPEPASNTATSPEATESKPDTQNTKPPAMPGSWSWF